MMDDKDVVNNTPTQPETESGLSEERKTEAQRPARSRTEDLRSGKRSAREVLLEDLSERSTKASISLRNNLKGTVLLELDQKEQFLFEWQDNKGVVKELTNSNASGSAPQTPDCIIKLLSSDLLRIVSGTLNPQIAMLSHKINVTGKAELAVYFFNLLAPRS